MRLRNVGSVLGYLAVLTVACSDGNSSGISTSVDQAKPVNALDDDESQDLCEDVAAWAEDNITPELFQRLGCIGDAVSAASEGGAGLDENACRTAYNDCVSQPYEDDVDFSAAQCNPDALPDCDVSVGDYLACAEDSFALLNDVLDAFDCSNLEALAEVEQPDYPASCTALEQSCPGFFGE